MLAVTASPSVRIDAILTSWQLGNWGADVALAFIVGAGLAYLWGVRRLSARGRAWSPRRSAAFAAGLALLIIVIDSGVASYDDSVFTVHVLQHVALMMIAPPLLSLGAPVTLAMQASARSVQSHIARVLHHRVVRVATSPFVVAGIYYGSMWGEMQTSFYPYSLTHPLVHDASHLVMLTLGCLFWWPLVALDELPHRPAAPVRLGLLFVGIPFEAFLGISIMAMGSSIAPEHTLSDTHTGGAVFWILSMAIMLAAAITISVGWMNQEERRAARADRHAVKGARPGAADTSQRDQLWEATWLARTGSIPGRSRND